MTQASGKGNCMFAKFNIPGWSILLILLSVFVCVTQLHAQLPEVMDQSSPGPVVEAEVAVATHKVTAEVAGFLESGNAALQSLRILKPENSNALYYFTRAMEKDPGNPQAQLGLVKVQEVLIGMALESAQDLDYELAETWLQEAAKVREGQGPVETARIEVTELKHNDARNLEHKAITAMDAGSFSLADFYIIDLIALGGQESTVDSLRARLKDVRIYGGFEPGQIIKDKLSRAGGNAPDLVIIPSGSFRMGAKGRDEGARDHEKPRHRVTFKQGFALGVREVSVAEFRLFIKSSGYRTAAELAGSSSVYDESAGRISNRKEVSWRHNYLGRKADPDMPVLHVNLHDAQAYVGWLTEETGKTYRLPSEAEYEYVARAGGSGSYWWGEGSPAGVVENLTGDQDRSSSNRQWTTPFKKYGDGYWGPAPTGSLVSGELSHRMGVRDITGNVSEWTEDCWHDNYSRAPVDGSAWVNRGCNRRVVRGGYWASSPTQCRAAFRISAKAETYGPIVGIRVARDL